MPKGQKKDEIAFINPEGVDKKLSKFVKPHKIPKGATEHEKVVLLALIELYPGINSVELLFVLIKKYLASLPVKRREELNKIIKKVKIPA